MGIGIKTKKQVSTTVGKIPYSERLKMYQDFRNWVLSLSPANGRLLLAITKSKIDEESLVKNVSKELVKMYVKSCKKSPKIEKFLNSLYYLSNYGEIEYRDNTGAIPELSCRNSEMYRIYNKEFRLALNILVGLREDGQRILYIRGVFPIHIVQ